MVQFGQNPSQGTLLRASQFLLGTRSEALVPIYAHFHFPIMDEKKNYPFDWRTELKNLTNSRTI